MLLQSTIDRKMVLLVVVVMIALEGCGWRLRGATTVDLVLPPMFVQINDADSALRLELARRLKTAGVAVVPERELASLILVAGPEATQRRVLSVGASGKAREYELQYTLRFAVNRPDGVAALPPQSVVLRRDYVFDEQQVLASDREQQRLFDQMRVSAVQDVLRRLSSARDKLVVDPPPTESATDAN